MQHGLRALLPWSLVVATIFAAAPSVAQSAAEFYKGKTIDLIVGYAPGAGYDAYAQLLRSAFAEHVPGNPGFLVKYMPARGVSPRSTISTTRRRATAR